MFVLPQRHAFALCVPFRAGARGIAVQIPVLIDAHGISCLIIRIVPEVAVDDAMRQETGFSAIAP